MFSFGFFFYNCNNSPKGNTYVVYDSHHRRGLATFLETHSQLNRSWQCFLVTVYLCSTEERAEVDYLNGLA